MKPRTIVATLFTLAFPLAIAVLPAQAQQPALKKITFLTNYTFHGRHSPFFVGREKGYYRDAGFDIDIQPATGSGFVITAVDSGKADYGMAEAASVVQAVAKGAKVKSFMVFTDISTSGLASLEPYPSLASLKGKRIAASQTDSARVILPILLERSKIDPNSVQWLAADPGVYSSLLLSGQTDLFTASIDGDVPALEKVALPLFSNQAGVVVEYHGPHARNVTLALTDVSWKDALGMICRFTLLHCVKSQIAGRIELKEGYVDPAPFLAKYDPNDTSDTGPGVIGPDGKPLEGYTSKPNTGVQAQPTPPRPAEPAEDKDPSQHYNDKVDEIRKNVTPTNSGVR